MRRVVLLLLGLPLVLVALGQVFFVWHPAVLVELLATAVLLAIALVLARPLSSRSRRPATLTAREWSWVALAAGLLLAGVVLAPWTPVEWPMSMIGAACVLGAVLLARGEDRATRAAGIGIGAIALLSPLVLPWESALGLLPMTGCVVLPALAVGLLVRGQRRTHRVQRDAARDRERRAMAEELHDVVAHELTGIVVLAQAVGPGMPPGPAADAVGRIEASGHRALEQIRSLVHALADPSEDALEGPGQGGHRPPRGVTDLAALPTLVSDFAATVPGEVSLEQEGLDRSVPPQVVLAASRVLTESLTNVRRHAMSAGQVQVRLSADSSSVQVEVVDDGAGGGLGPGNSSGLTGLAERVSLVGGTLMSGPAETGGWRVHAVLPSTLPRRTGRARPTPGGTGGRTTAATGQRTGGMSR